MDFLDFDKLNKQVSMCEGIAANTSDTTSYNAVTQKSNNVLTEATADIDEVISNGNDINDVVDFDDLENTVHKTLGVDLSGESDVKEREMKDKEIDPVTEGIDNAKDFQNAEAINQTDFVEEKTGSKQSKELDDANTNTEHVVTEHKSDDVVEKQADGNMKDMQKIANDNKEWEENSKTQKSAEAKSILQENAKKYVAFVESLRDNENSHLIDGIIKAFNIIQ